MTLRFLFRPVLGLGRQFYLLFAAGMLSNIGSFTTQTALLLHIYNLSGHNAAYMGLTALCELAPYVLASPLSGILAERHNRKSILILNELVRIPLVLLLAATNSIPLLLGLACLISISTTLALPARQTLIPQTVVAKSLTMANSLNGGMSSVLHVLGPVLGALLYSRAGNLTLTVLIEAAASLGAAVLLCWLDAAAAQPAPAIERRPLLRELVTGMEYVRKSPDLRQILIMLILSGIANGLFMALLRPLVGEALHGGDSQYTQLVSFFGLGGLLGPVVGYYAGQRFGLGRTLLAAFVIEAILLSLLSNVQSMQLATVIMLFWGLNEFAVLPCYMSYVHLRTEPETMGRTFAVFGQAEYMPQVFAAALVGVVGSRLPVQHILAITSIAYLALLVLTLPSQGSRALRANRQLALALPQSAGSD